MPESSKVALVTLVEILREAGYVLLDTQYVNEHLKRAVPEYRRTIAGYMNGRIKDGLSISWPLAFVVPGLFAVMWLAFFAWMFHNKMS